MSKQKTKADLEREIATLENKIKVRDEKIEQYEKEIHRHIDSYQALLEDISSAIQPTRFEYVVDDGRYPTLNQSRVKQKSVTAIFFRIGRLVTIAEEYAELKDRVLPIEKSKVLAHEIQNHKA